MGLDVYLERCDNWSDKIQREKEFNDQVEDQAIVWDSPAYRNLSDRMGLVDGHFPTESISLNSNVDPEHLMKVGYFRSSYNGSGLNSVLRGRIGKDLYYIFSEAENYQFVPNWAVALVRCNEVIEEFAENLKTTAQYSVIDVGPNVFRTPEVLSDKEALEAFLEEIGREKKYAFDGSYSNAVGHFFPKGLNIKAAIEGLGVFGKPVIYLVYENTQETADWKWYTDALLIVRETILYVLEQSDPSEYGLVWSS